MINKYACTKGLSGSMHIVAASAILAAVSFMVLAVPAQAQQAPGAPVLYLSPGNGQIMASWTAEANGAPITAYLLQHRQVVGGSWVDVNLTGTSYTVTGLSNDTLYEVKVRATNSVGDGDWSYVVSATP